MRQCDYRTWGYWIDGMSIDSFIAKSDLPEAGSLPGVFTVGVPPEVHLGATAVRWAELVGARGAAGL